MIYKKKLPLIRQVELSECGLICVLMISNYHGHQLDRHALRAMDKSGIQGSTLVDLINILEKLQFKTRAIRVEVQGLHQVLCPAILHWNMNHFVVLKSLRARYAIIHDPALGRRKISLDALSKSFTGVVLEIEKAVDFSALSSSNTLKLFDLFRPVKGFTKNLFVLFLLSLAVEGFILIHPIFLQYITDHLTHTHQLINLTTTSTFFIILTFFHSFFDYMRRHFVLYLINRMSEYFSSGMMQHLLKLPLEYFEKRHKGDVLSRFHAIGEIQNKITKDSMNILLDGMVIFLAFLIMAIYSMPLTAIVASAVLVTLIIRIFTYHHLKNQTEASVTLHAQMNSKFLEILQHIMSIKLFSKESIFYRDWNNGFIRSMNADIEIARVNIAFGISNLFIFNLEHISVLVVGALLVVKNKFSLGMLVAFLAYRQVLINKASSFIYNLFEYKLISIQVDRVSDILLQKTEPEESAILIQNPIRGDIKVQNLDYSYPGSQGLLLSKIHFHVHPAEKVVIKGPSGIGKTTLLKIMLGLIRPTHGSVLVDDMALNLLGAKKYRSFCASVMQDDRLISASLLDNITWMENKIDMERVIHVAKIAHVHEDIMLMPMGYETLVGDMGGALSGGQKQRILLARALYKKPKILFLDEATSHLDTNTEKKINRALKQLHMTQVVIAHREETIKMADRVIELSCI